MRLPAAGTAQDYVFKLAAVALTVFVLHAAQPVLLPLALALLGAFVLSPVVVLTQRAGLPRVPAVVATLVATGTAIVGIGLVVVTQLGELVRDLPNHRQQMEAKIDQVRGSGVAVSRLLDMVHEIGGDKSAPGQSPIVARVEEGTALSRSLEPVLMLLEPVAVASLVLVLMIFVLIGREDLRSRLMAVLGRGQLTGTVRILDDASRRIGRYLLFQLLLNAAVGLLFAVGLMLLDVPYAALWGLLTAALRFIPYVGSWISLLLPLSISFAMSPDWQQPLMVLAYFTVLDVIVANIVEPLLFGHHTGVSPLALLVAAAFWAWVWGPVGLLVSTPLTVCLVVMGQHVPHLQTLAFLLGDQPALAPHLEFYQRVLAGGSDAGATVVREAAAAEDMVRAFDKVLIPALAMVRADRTSGVLTPDEEQRIYRATAANVPEGVPGASVPDLGRNRLTVLGTPAHHESEELALRMLAAALESRGHQMEVLTTRLLPADVVRRTAETGALAVVISIMPPGGLPQTAYLCRLLRNTYPDLPIIVARWGSNTNYDRLLVRLRRAGASYLTTSLVQTRTQVEASRSADTAGRVPPARVPA